MGRRTVQKICKEANVDGILSEPNMANVGRRTVEVDSFTEGVIRRSVLEAYSQKVFPTLDYMHKSRQEDPNFPRMSRTTLHKVMRKQLKFKFGKFNGKPIPMDRPDIAADRASYLRHARRYRQEGYHVSLLIFFFGEYFLTLFFVVDVLSGRVVD